MESFKAIYQRSADRKGGKQGLEQLLSKPESSQYLRALPDSRYLAEFTKKVFQSGFVWRIVEQKWPSFEQVFWQFDVEKLVLMPPEMLEQKATDPAIVRHMKKVQAIIDNAVMIKIANEEQGGFARLIADWPTTDIIGLWQYLKINGARLGGNTGPYGLRALGKDTFLLSGDVEAYFRNMKLIEGGLNSKRNHRKIQETFNEWQQQSGRSLQEISRIVAFGVGDNRV